MVLLLLLTNASDGLLSVYEKRYHIAGGYARGESEGEGRVAPAAGLSGTALTRSPGADP